ncbi:MAG: hypothetical protein SVS85_00185 [Candidatus Nanohaloarchaea archaeon]|nr:hypothetical protein [Candidatus Nanohaloarchaea archaeon]
MRALNHFIISALAAPLAVTAIYTGLTPPGFLFFYCLAVAAGVLIDLDHFLLARWKTGSWEQLFKALESPYRTFTDEDSVMGEDMGGTVSPGDRIVSHLTVLMLVLALYLFQPRLSLLLVYTVSLHILADLFQDWRNGRLMSFRTR